MILMADDVFYFWRIYRLCLESYVVSNTGGPVIVFRLQSMVKKLDELNGRRCCPFFAYLLSTCRKLGDLNDNNSSWCFEPSQPQRITSGLKTNFSLSSSYSLNKL